MSIFDGVDTAALRLSSNYIEEGHFILRIDAVKVGVSRKKADFVAIESTVLSNFDEGDEANHAVGDNVTHMLMVQQDMFLSSFKTFICKSMGVEPDEVSAEACEQACNMDPEKGTVQPMAGIFVEVVCKDITTKKGSPFTVVNYKGPVDAKRVAALMSEKDMIKVFPNNELQQLVQLEEAV
jgi:hypothetical protein